MKAIRFKKYNRILLGMIIDEQPIENLPVYIGEGIITSCWKMSFKERLKALVHGRVWLQVMSGTTHPPLWLFCNKNGFENKKRQNSRVTILSRGIETLERKKEDKNEKRKKR